MLGAGPPRDGIIRTSPGQECSKDKGALPGARRISVYAARFRSATGCKTRVCFKPYHLILHLGEKRVSLCSAKRQSARSSMDRASDYGSEGWGFESLRARSGPPRCDPPVGVLHFYQALLRECFFHAHPLVVVPASRFSVRSEVTSAQQRAYLSGGATELAQHAPFRSCSAKKFAQRSPSCGVFALAPIMGPSRANFFAHRAQHVATVKPPSPLHPKNAPKTPISRPQRRWRFQTTGPPGRQSLTTAPVGGGWASPRHPWAISVTNVVKPTLFKSPHEDPCYKRRQSKPKNQHFQRKSR